ncbi:hypothetical protein NDU88_004264 [Pleurodeles waltl]|uniref:Uncharacterized protein n=1 Tax=Pleurodeles waltl TaxID=8319 RepID=A0AAV7RFA0_PLEWA|nr:hypothetical protein NDU88_004264 [Pleurodeles waltl]
MTTDVGVVYRFQRIRQAGHDLTSTVSLGPFTSAFVVALAAARVRAAIYVSGSCAPHLRFILFRQADFTRFE